MSFDAVPVQYGWLGGYRADSGKFVAPETAGIPDEPLVSCLCVTENRHAFMPWLLWNFDKQTWGSRELVVVDSSSPPIELPERSDIRVIHVPTGTSLGKKRNIALDAARGAVVAWFDDDDWQHTQRLSKLVPLLRKCATRLGASFVGPSKSHFIDLHASRAEAYRMHRYAIFNGAVFYTHMVRHARFPEDVLRTEDTLWIQALLHDRQGAALVGNVPTYFLWLSHDVNVTNARSKRQLPLKAESLIRSLGSAWGDTPAQLSKLRARLARQPASRPLRVVQAEGECVGRACARDQATPKASAPSSETLHKRATQPAAPAPPSVVQNVPPATKVAVPHEHFIPRSALAQEMLRASALARQVSRPVVAPSTPKVVPVSFGRLGNHRPGSRRCQAPDLTRISEKPLVSCLCVTENRHAFMPWLLWGYDRQAWKERELVVVDSSEPPVSLPKRADIRVLHVPPGTSLGKKRNLALEAARGHVVAWFDDDDWQHPKRLSSLVPLLREYAVRIGASFIGPSRSHFLDIDGRRCERYHMVRYAIFNGSVYYRDMVRHARFPEDVLRTEDTHWISTLLRKRQGAAIVDEQPSLFLWLCHAVNVSNAKHVRRLPLDSNELVRSLGSAWADTPQRLAELRHRLATSPAKRPVRVALAEPRSEPNDPAPALPEVRPAPPASPPDTPRVDPIPRRVAPAARNLSLYLACTNARAEKPGYVSVGVSPTRFGWLDALPLIYMRRRGDWLKSDFVGILDGDAVWHPDLDLVVRSLERRAAHHAIWVLGEIDRRPLKAHLAAYPNGAELARDLLEWLSIRDPGALEAEVVSCESGWMATPSVFSEYVRNWLIPARTVLGRRRASEAATPVMRRLLEVLPAIAFSRERRGVHALGLSKQPRTNPIEPRSGGTPATLVAPAPRANGN